MLERIGNIWDHHAEGGWIVITTNIGWKKDGSNPMGAGIAKAAAEKYPNLPVWYGKFCQKYGADMAVRPYAEGRLFLFPTKPLAEQPWLSWKNDACLDLIRRSALQLSTLIDILGREVYIKPVGVPMVGCQNGHLRPKQVLPILRRYLDDRFVLFESKNS